MVLHNVRVIEKTGEDGQPKKFIAFPSHKVYSAENNNIHSGYVDIYHPIKQSTRKKFEDAIYTALANSPVVK